MNEIETCLIERRSTKNFLPKPVPKDVLERILTAGTYAATGRGRQSPIILAVTNKALRDRLSRINADILGTDADPFYGAPVVLVVLAEREVHTHVYDGSLVMGNLILAAESEGVGSCWIHRAKETFEREEGKQILRELGIEDKYEGIGNCVLGYPAGAPRPAAPRKDGYIVWAE